MLGVSTDTFDPQGITTRGMMPTILYRMEEEPESINDADFSDVSPGLWCSRSCSERKRYKTSPMFHQDCATLMLSPGPPKKGSSLALKTVLLGSMLTFQAIANGVKRETRATVS